MNIYIHICIYRQGPETAARVRRVLSAKRRRSNLDNFASPARQAEWFLQNVSRLDKVIYIYIYTYIYNIIHYNMI